MASSLEDLPKVGGSPVFLPALVLELVELAEEIARDIEDSAILADQPEWAGHDFPEFGERHQQLVNLTRRIRRLAGEGR